jgi:lambda family phage portal protein
LKLRDKILRRFGYYPVSETVKLVKRYAQRSYEGAGTGRFLTGWSTANREIDTDLRNGRSPIMARARDLEKNNDVVKGALIKSGIHIIGPDGFKFQSRVINDDGSYDDLANKQIEEKFEEWCEAEYCSLDKRLDFHQQQLLAINCLKRDGEHIARIITGNYGSKGLVNDFGIAIQPLDSTDLDETYSENLKSGNVVKMGVEMDNETREHVAYYTRTVQQELGGGSSYTRVRVPADEIVFGFDVTRVRQTRGMSHFAQSLIKLYQLSEWENNSLINSNVAAKKLGFITTKVEGQYEGEEDEEHDEEGNIIDRMESGQWEYLAPNQEIQTFDPKFPSDQHAPFVKAILRSIATGLGISYNALANDLEGVNFSSMRSGALEERDVWMLQQALFIKTFLKPIFKKWLNMAFKTGQLNLPFSKFKKFNKPEFVPRRWDWVDPRNDIEAKKQELELGITTKTAIAASKGKDYEDNLKELAREKKLEEKYGFEPAKSEGTKGPANDKAGGPDESDNAGEGKDKSGRAHRPRILQLGTAD